MQSQTILRVARPTNDIEAVLQFYRDGLGLSELYRFADHDGFDGVMLGLPGGVYHFEFTRARGHDAGRAPTQDNLIVFYLPERREWDDAIERMKSHGFLPVPSFNPFWNQKGVTFEDRDGYRVVLQNSDWRAAN